MSAGLEARAEVLKLARLLGSDAASLEYLVALGPAPVRALRECATDVLFDADRQTLERIAVASRLLPPGLLAQIAERSFGPLLCARASSLLDPGRAIDVAAHLSPSFLADVSIELDPRRSSDVIARLPARHIVAVARELLRREDFITMGRFVGHLGDDVIAEVLPFLDDRALLRIAFVMEVKENLDRLIDLLPPDRLGGVIRAAAEADLWPEALDLVASVGERRQAQLADIAAEQDDAVLDALVRTAQQQRLWDAVLPLARAMSEDSRRRFAALPSVHDPEVLTAIVDAAVTHGLWPQLLPLVPPLPQSAQQHLAAIGAALERDALEQVVRAAAEHDLWPALTHLVAEMDEPGQRRIAELIAETDGQVVEAFIASASEHELWPEVLAIAQQMADGDRRRLAERIVAAGVDGVVPALVAAADRTGLWEPGLRLLSELDPPLQQRLVASIADLSGAQRARVAEQARAHGLLGALGPLGVALAAA